MMKKRRRQKVVKPKGPVQKIWDVLFPVAIYYITLVIAMMFLETFFGTSSEGYMFRQLLASLVAIPVVYTHFRYDRITQGRPTLRQVLITPAAEGKTPADTADVIFATILISALLSVSLNNLIGMSPLVSISAGYEEASENFYGGMVLFEILGSGLVVPILEETLFRGVVFLRLLHELKLPLWPAVLLSALLFGAVHFNLVQFLYATLLGVVLALFLQRAGHVYASILGHMTANLLAILRTETGWLSFTTDGSAAAFGISFLLLLAGLLFLTALLRTPRSEK